MRNLFLEALERVPDMTEREKQVVGDLYNTVFGENTPDADIVDQATDEPPSLAEFETLGKHEDDNINITEEGLKMTQTLPDGTDVTTVQ